MTVLSKKLAYPEFFRAITDAAQSKAISFPSGALAAWYQPNTVHRRHVIIDDEVCYTIFLKRNSSEQAREEEGAVALTLQSAAQWQREPEEYSDAAMDLMFQMPVIELSDEEEQEIRPLFDRKGVQAAKLRIHIGLART